MHAKLKGNKIALSFSYNPAVLRFIRTLDGRGYDPRHKEWLLPLTVSEVNLRNLQKLGFALDPAIFNAIKRDLTRVKVLEGISHQPDASLDTTLPMYHFQRVASSWMIASGSGINAYPVGTGKTLMTLAALEHLHCQRILIIAPKSLQYQWQAEINKWLPNWQTTVIDGNRAQRAKLYATSNPLLILSYDLARIDFDLLNSLPPWDVIVCDEAHRLGTVSTKTRKAIKQYQAAHRFGLTATPLMNHPAELYGLIDWCQPGALGSYKLFLERYTKRNKWGGILYTLNLKELSANVRRYMIRKELSELAVELPPLTIEDVPFDLSGKERALYHQLRAELLFDIEQSLINKVENPVLVQMTLVKMLRLLELCDSMELLGEDQTSSKLEILKDRLTDIGDNKVIIFSRFKRMINILERELEAFKPCVITGDITGQGRAAALEAFRSNPDRRIMLCSEAGGEGLNLEAANIIFHYDLPYSYGKYVQRNGRIARLTQTKPMMVYNLIARDSMDEKVAKIIAKKQDLAEILLGSDLTQIF